jgi:hypothetical protein
MFVIRERLNAHPVLDYHYIPLGIKEEYPDAVTEIFWFRPTTHENVVYPDIRISTFDSLTEHVWSIVMKQPTNASRRQ